MYTEDGEKVRVSRRTGTVIPKPPELKVNRIREAYQGSLFNFAKSFDSLYQKRCTHFHYKNENDLPRAQP